MLSPAELLSLSAGCIKLSCMKSEKHTPKQCSHFLENQGVSGRNSVLTRMSGNFAVWRGICCSQILFAFVSDNKCND